MLRMLRLIQFVGICGMFVAGLAMPAIAQPAPEAVGVYGLWGAFRSPERCYAIAAPVQPGARDTRPFASVSYWPRQRVRGQLHVRLSRPKRDGSAVLLRIDGRSFQLVGRGWDAWAPDARADADLIAAMRTGLAMTIETRGENGRLVRDHYRLRGAATAVDAAAVACLAR
jgi:hypothetical protein